MNQRGRVWIQHEAATSSHPGSAASLVANFPSLNLNVLTYSTEITVPVSGVWVQDLMS